MLATFGHRIMRRAIVDTVEQAERHAAYLCRHRGRCLDDVTRLKWEGFSCVACPARSDLTREEQRSDLHGLAELVQRVFERQRGRR